jgi:diadenosine tetraphosphatase ApaH/serine/threonine PP2A family protein phosphatase
MLIALFADIHANREALTACLADARQRGTKRYVFLGDLVGYGADPAWVVETVMAHVADGAVAILGNHDHALADPSVRMNSNARIAIEWTRAQLGPVARAFLAGLPNKAAEGGRVYVHAGGPAPGTWRYIVAPEDALPVFDEHEATWVFCGHVHIPALFDITAGGKITQHRPTTGIAIPVRRQRRWLSVLGSVGQPRDDIPSAAYTLFDTATEELIYCRVAYDIDRAADKIRQAGLPSALADRLYLGH